MPAPPTPRDEFDVALNAAPTQSAYDPDIMRFRADPLADATVAAIVGEWAIPAGATTLDALLQANAERLQHLHIATRLFSTWRSNAALDNWTAPPDTPAHIAQALERYLAQARSLPDWADAALITRGEKVFTDHGPLSVVSLFCASLPDCYVQPKAAAVLQISGQLEAHADYRIRSTAAMVFPVMLQGGLTAPTGVGVAQTLKVRLIHATIRNLVLRGAPEAMLDTVVNAVSSAANNGNAMHSAFLAHGWNVPRDGLPSNQEQLVFTLLTFHYVFLRALRTLGIGLRSEDEVAYLHCWNVVGHLLGIERRWMPFCYADAERLFRDIQSRCLADRDFPGGVDSRVLLTRALLDYMSAAIPLRILKPFPALLTGHLCGPEVAKALAVTERTSLLSRALFAGTMGAARCIDAVTRLFLPQFSLSRLFSRVVGYHLLTKFLLDQTRPLKLPTHLIGQIHATAAGWSDDPDAPRWLNRIEDALTTEGTWRAPAH